MKGRQRSESPGPWLNDLMNLVTRCQRKGFKKDEKRDQSMEANAMLAKIITTNLFFSQGRLAVKTHNFIAPSERRKGRENVEALA